MKKLIAIMFAFLLLSLCGCGGEQKSAESAANAFGGDLLAKAQQKAAEKEAAAAEWVEVDGDEPFGQYRSVEKLRDIIENGSPDEGMLPVTWETPTIQAQEDGQSYSGSTESGVFSDEGWPESGVVYHYDWQSEMAADLAAEGYDPSTIIGPDGQLDMEELRRQTQEMDEADTPSDPFDEYTEDGVMGADDFMDYFENYLGIDMDAFIEQTQ